MIILFINIFLLCLLCLNQAYRLTSMAIFGFSLIIVGGPMVLNHVAFHIKLVLTPKYRISMYKALPLKFMVTCKQAYLSLPYFCDEINQKLLFWLIQNLQF
jgi:hypothetical protein